MGNEEIGAELDYQLIELRSLDYSINDMAESLLSRLSQIATRIDNVMETEREDSRTAQQLADMERMLTQRINLMRHIRALAAQGEAEPFRLSPIMLY